MSNTRRPMKSSVMPMPKDHGWVTREGFQIIVADQGALRFDVPSGWQVTPGEDCDLHITDTAPPDDDCCLKVTLFRFPFVPDAPPLLELLQQVAERSMTASVRTGPTLERAAGADLVWEQARYDEDGREAVSRTVIARGSGRYALLTMALWADREVDFEPAWVELRSSLVLGASYDLSGRDPRRN